MDSNENPYSLGKNPVSNGINKRIVGMWSTAASNQNIQQDSAADPVPNKRRNMNGEAPKKRRKVTQMDLSPPAKISLADLGGIDDIICELNRLIAHPMSRPQLYRDSKIQPPRGILLHGPPGCGKTMIANAFAAEIDVNFMSISAPSIVSGMSGESERALRDYFDEAKKVAPCLVFIDEIDAITPKRESAQREMEKRIVAQLLTCMDDLSLEKTDGRPVIVLAATNRPDSLDAALRRGGRFDREINMSVPSEPVREQILRTLTRDMPLEQPIDFALLAKRTPGFVGADLSDLISTAGSNAIERDIEILESRASAQEMNTEQIINPTSLGPGLVALRRFVAYSKQNPSISNEPSSMKVTMSDFLTALPKIQPSSKREGFATIPDTTWSDIGALSSIREELQTCIIQPILTPDLYSQVGIRAPSGVLLWGPPGCGKTLLAKAVANESRANFISIKGPELLNKFVGESERAVRQVFVRARSSVPCVVFFDELDALVPKRDDGLSDASARVVNTLLTELDGVGNTRDGIYVVAATNRPDIIDPAMLRPGRLDTMLFVDLPGAEERVEILRTLTRKISIQFSEEMAELARQCDSYSGADMESLLRRAGYAAIRRKSRIELEDLVVARKEVRPSVTDMSKYHYLNRQWGRQTS